MDSVKEVFRAAAAALEPLLSNSNGGLPGKAGAGSILEQLFPVRKALSRVPLPVDLPAPLPNPLKGPSPQPDRNAGRLPSAGKASRKSPAGQSYMPHVRRARLQMMLPKMHVVKNELGAPCGAR